MGQKALFISGFISQFYTVLSTVVNAKKKLLNDCQLVILYITRFSVRQKATRSLSHFRFVIHNSHVDTSPTNVPQSVNSLFVFVVFNTADKVIVPHLQRTS